MYSVSLCVCVLVCRYMFKCMWVHVLLCVYVYMFECLHVFVCTRVCVHVYEENRI